MDQGATQSTVHGTGNHMYAYNQVTCITGAVHGTRNQHMYVSVCMQVLSNDHDCAAEAYGILLLLLHGANTTLPAERNRQACSV
jgi:hypothetical protein